MFRREPDNLKVHCLILVKHDVSHRSHLGPRDVGVSLLSIGRYVLTASPMISKFLITASMAMFVASNCCCVKSAVQSWIFSIDSMMC